MVLDRWGGRDATEWNRSDPKEPANRLSAEVNQHIQTSKMRKTVGTTVSYLLTRPMYSLQIPQLLTEG